MSDNETWDTADVKTCDHGYVFLEHCPNCGGSGEVTSPHVYVGCACCKNAEKYKPCKKCNGKGILSK